MHIHVYFLQVLAMSSTEFGGGGGGGLFSGGYGMYMYMFSINVCMLLLCCSHGNQARGGGIDLMDGSGANAISKRVANGEFVNVKSPQNCKVFVNNVSFLYTVRLLSTVSVFILSAA